MENLIIREGPLTLIKLVGVMEKSGSFPQLLKGWKNFARNLGVDETVITDLDRKLGIDTTKLHDVPYEILNSWTSKSGRSSTLKALLVVLVQSNLHNIAESLEREFWLFAVKKLKIKFYDIVLSLEEALQENASEEIYQHIYCQLKAKAYTQPIQLLREDVIPKPATNYYIPRTLSYMIRVNEDIFRADLKNHLLLVKGISKHELAKLSGFKPVDVSGNQLYEITVQVMVLQCDTDFDRISKITQHPVHFIEFKNGLCFWVKSNKKLDTIQRFLLEDRETYSEDELIAKLSDANYISRAVSISDSPGMGKSFTLENLASKLKARCMKSIVIVATLNEFVKQIKCEIDSTSAVLAAIAEYACFTEAKNISKLILEVIIKTDSLELFLDGYDEVASQYLETVDSVLRHTNQLKNVRLFVTSRPHMRQRLENILNLSSYEILPFDESNQIEFLTKYWTKQFGAQHEEQLKRYAKRCLKALRLELSETERKLAGIPLQCKLVADVFADGAQRATEIDGESTETIMITSLYDIYKKLINLKFRRVPEVAGSYLTYLFKTDVKSRYINAHIHDSIALLYPDWVEAFKPFLEGYTDIEETIIYSIGIMEKSPCLNVPRFVHRTFAEYLLAEYLVTNLDKNGKAIEMMFSAILGGNGIVQKTDLEGPVVYMLQNPTIGYFANMHLRDKINCSPLNEFVPSISKHRSKINFENICKSMSACGIHDFEACFDLLIEVFDNLYVNHHNPLYLIHVRDTYFKHLPHLIVQNSKNDKLVKKVLDLTKHKFKVDPNYHVFETDETFSYPWISGCTPLHVAAHYGKYNIVTFLIKEFEDRVKGMKYLLHTCARYSSSESDSVIQDKLSIIELFLKVRKTMLHESLNDRTPVLEQEVHPKLLRRFVDGGSDINSFSTHGTILHTSGSKLNYNEFVQWAISSGFKLINHQDSEGKSPLSKAVARIQVGIDEKTLKLFAGAGANFDLSDKYRDSVLFHGLKTGRPAAVISELINYGASVNHVNTKNQNAAHFLLGNSSFKDTSEVLEKLRLLVSKGFNALNLPDVEGVLPICQLVENIESFDCPELFEFLRLNGVDFNTLCNIQRRFGSEQDRKIISQLLQAPLSNIVPNVFVTRKNYQGLPGCLKSSIFDEVISWAHKNLDEHSLIRDKYIPEIIDLTKSMVQNKSGNFTNFLFQKVINLSWTVLFHAVGRISLACVEKLIECGASVNIEDDKHFNLAHAAIFNAFETKLDTRKLIHVLRLIISKGFNKIDRPNNHGSTPIHFSLELISTDLTLLMNLFHENGTNFNAVNNNGKTILHCAIENSNDAKIIRKLIEYGVDLHHINTDKQNALHLAAYYRNASALEFLIDKFDIESKNTFGRTPLHELVSLTDPLDPKLLDLFRERDANFNSVDNNGWSILFLAIGSNQNATTITRLIEHGADLSYLNLSKANLLHVAACNRNVSALEFLIDKFDIESKTMSGQTALHYLVMNKKSLDTKLLDLFLEKGANFNAVDNEGCSVLNWAIMGNQNTAIIKKLLAYGANLDHVNNYNENVIHVAALYRNLPALEFPVNTFNFEPKYEYTENLLCRLNSKGTQDPKILHLFHCTKTFVSAIEDDKRLALLMELESNPNSASLAKNLCENGAEFYRSHFKQPNAFHLGDCNIDTSALKYLIKKFGIDSRNTNGRTPLHQLVTANEPLDAKLLAFFQENGADFNAVDNHGWSVLLTAIQGNQNAAIVSKLLDYGADLYHHNLNKANALHISAYYRNYSALNFVIDKFDIHLEDKYGRTPLRCLVSNEQPLDANLLALFHEKGADFNAANKNGSILLEAIRCNQSAAIISKIIDHGGDTHYLTLNNYNALHVATGFANFDVLEFLLDKFSYDINVADSEGETPLHYVFWLENRDYRNVLTLLLERSPNFEIKNKKGYTPLTKWIIQGKDPIPTLLELQDILPISSDIASNALTALVCQNALLQDYLINSTESKRKTFKELFNLLIRKEARLVMNNGSPVTPENFHENLATLDKIVLINDQLKQHILRYFDVTSSSQEPNVLFSDLIIKARVPMEAFLDGLLATELYEYYRVLSSALKTEILRCSSS